MTPRLLPGLTGLFALAACAAPQGDYPSLAIRDVERVSGQMEPAPPAYAPAPLPAETGDRLQALAEQAAAAHETFLSGEDEARRRVRSARGAEPGSEGWARAQVAIAALEAARSQAMIALADLDRIYVDTALDVGELTRIATIRGQVAAQVAEQDSIIDELAARTGS